MTPDEIERALAGEPAIEPSTRFVSRVMRSVRADAVHRARGPFPWRQTWPALALASVLIPLGVAALLLGDTGPAREDVVRMIQWLSLTVTATMAFATWCTGLVMRR